jgi:hypothetical protein
MKCHCIRQIITSKKCMVIILLIGILSNLANAAFCCPDADHNDDQPITYQFVFEKNARDTPVTGIHCILAHHGVHSHNELGCTDDVVILGKGIRPTGPQTTENYGNTLLFAVGMNAPVSISCHQIALNQSTFIPRSLFAQKTGFLFYQ